MYFKVFRVALGTLLCASVTAALGLLPINSPTLRLNGGYAQTLATAEAQSLNRSEDTNLLARVVAAEAEGDHLRGKQVWQL
jgi:hypothetical protein